MTITDDPEIVLGGIDDSAPAPSAPPTSITSPLLPTAVATPVPAVAATATSSGGDIERTTNTDGSLSIKIITKTPQPNGYREIKIEYFTVPAGMASAVSISLDNGEPPSSLYMTKMEQQILPPDTESVISVPPAAPINTPAYPTPGAAAAGTAGTPNTNYEQESNNRTSQVCAGVCCVVVIVAIIGPVFRASRSASHSANYPSPYSPSYPSYSPPYSPSPWRPSNSYTPRPVAPTTIKPYTVPQGFHTLDPYWGVPADDNNSENQFGISSPTGPPSLSSVETPVTSDTLRPTAPSHPTAPPLKYVHLYPSTPQSAGEKEISSPTGPGGGDHAESKDGSSSGEDDAEEGESDDSVAFSHKKSHHDAAQE